MSRLVMLPKRDKCQTFGRFYRCRPMAGSMRQHQWTPSAVLPKAPEADYLVSVRGLMSDSGRLHRNNAVRALPVIW